MNRLLKIVGRISDKSAKAKVFSLVLCSVILLLLVFSVYSVFGEGITGAAVAGPAGEPSDDGKCFGDGSDGWVCVDEDVTYFAYGFNTTSSNGEVSSRLYMGQHFFLEDGEVKIFEELKDARGYVEFVKNKDDKNFSLEILEVNNTFVKFKLSVVNSEMVDKDIPVSVDGVQKSVINIISLGDSQEFSVSPAVISDFNIFDKSFTFGSHTINGSFWAVNNNTFKMNKIMSYYPENVYENPVDPQIYNPVLNDNRILIFFAPITYYVPVGVTYDNLTFCIWNDRVFDPALGVTAGLTEDFISSVATWNVNDSAPESDTWTDDYVMHGIMSPGVWSWAVEIPNYDAYVCWELTSIAQARIDSTGNLSIFINSTLGSGGFEADGLTQTGLPYFDILYTPPNTAPSNPSVSLSPSPTANGDFDLSCTFTPVDPDNETLTAYVDWYNNTGTGGVIALQNNMVVTVDGQPKNFVLDDAYTTVGEYWNCSVRVCDHVTCSDWSNSSETEIVSVANKTDFTTQLQSLNVKDVYVYDASRESWNMTNDTTSWYEWVTNKKFPDKVYLFLTDAGLDIFDVADTNNVWMYFNSSNGKAIEANDFTSVYALDGRIYVGSDKGLYVLDFVDDIILRYDNSNGLAYNDSDPFYIRNNPPFSYTIQDGSKKLASNVVNDVHAKKVKGKHMVAVATDGSVAGAVNIIHKETGNIAELDFVEYQTPNKEYKSESVFIADDGTLYYSENRKSAQGKTKLSSKYSIDTYTGTTGKADYSYSSKDDLPAGSPLPKFLSEQINDIYVTSGTSRMHQNHNTMYIATEKGISVIQEVQNNEGVGATKTYSYTGSSESVNYKVLEGVTDNVTAVTARSDGNAIYVGTNSGNGFGSVSKISLNSNSLVASWNTTTDTTIVGNDTTSLDFLDGDLLVGTLSNGATQLVEQELDHYLITEKDKHRVMEIDSTGLIHFEFGVYNAAGDDDTHLNNPTHAVRLKNGNTLIADYGNQRILEINPDGGIVTNITNSTPLSDATYLDGIYSVEKITGILF